MPKKTFTHSRSVKMGSHSPPKGKSVVYVEAFQQYPPIDAKPVNKPTELPKTWISEEDSSLFQDDGDANFLITLADFRKTRSPYAALKAFVGFHEKGVYPPVIIMKVLAEGIQKYLSGKGTKSLEKCLGLVGGKGRDDIFAAEQKRNRDLIICQHMVIWTNALKLSAEHAAPLVACRFGHLSGATILKRFRSRAWAKDREFYLSPREFNQIFNLQNFVSQYPYGKLSALLSENAPKHFSRILKLHRSHQAT